MSKKNNKRKKIILVSIVALFIAVFGLVKIGKIDKYKGLVKVEKFNIDTRVLSASIANVASDNNTSAKGYDEINYYFTYSLSDYDTPITRDVIIKGKLSDEEKRYAYFRNVNGTNISSTLSDDMSEIEILVSNVPVGVDNNINLKLNIINAPNGFTVNPTFKIREVTEEEDNNVNVNPVTVTTRSIKGKVLDTNELEVSNVELGLFKNNKEVQRTYTDENGSYVFSDVETGAYQVKILEEIYEIDGTNGVSLNGNETTYNLRVKQVTPYEIRVNKNIIGATLVVNGKTEEYTYDNLSRVQQTIKNAKTISGNIKYNVVVKNVGKKEGTITAVKDAIPEGMSFDKEKNSGWVEEDGVLYYRPIEGVVLKANEERNITLNLSIVETTAAKTYLNSVTTYGDSYEKVVFILNNEVYKEVSVLEGEKVDNVRIDDNKFTGWFTDKNYTNKYNFNLPVKKDIILYGNTKEEHTITFIDQGEVWDIKTAVDGDPVEKPEDPTKEGHDFKCWEDENHVEWDFANPVFRDLTLTSCYSKKHFSVKFYDKAASKGSSYELLEDATLDKAYEETISNDEIPAPSSLPHWDGHTFEKWTLDEAGNEEFSLDTKIKKNIKLYSQYTTNDVAVIFNDENRITNKVLKYGDKVPLDEIPEAQGKTGYHFMNYWSLEYNGSEAFNFEETEITDTVTVYAVYEINTYDVIYNDVDPDPVPPEEPTPVPIGDPVPVPHGDPVPPPPVNPEHEGFTCDRWSTKINGDYDLDAFDLTTPITESINLYNLCTKKSYTVEFYDGDDKFTQDQIVKYKELAVEPEEKPSKDNYKFTGWTLDGELYDFNTPVTKNIKLYSSYENIEPPVVTHTPTTWTNQNVILTIKNDEHPEYHFKYKKGLGDFEEYFGETEIEENMVITAHSYVGEDVSVDVEHPITNIDKIKPVINSVEASNITQTGFNVNINSIDHESGVAQVDVYINNTLYNSYTYENKEDQEVDTLAEVSGLNPLTPYTVKVIVTDTATNISDASTINVDTLGYDYVVQNIGRRGILYDNPSMFTPFTSVKLALDDCGNEQCTLQMLKSVSESNDITADQEVTLDLNGLNITGVKNTTFNNLGSFTVIDNSDGDEKGAIINTTDTAIESSGELTIGEDESPTDPIVSVTTPKIKGISFGINKTAGTFNFYDGVIIGDTAIGGVVDDTPYMHEANVSSQLDGDVARQNAILQVVTDAEARIKGAYYTRLRSAVEDAKTGSYIDVMTEKDFTEGLEASDTYGFDYDEENHYLYSNNNVENTQAKTEFVLDLTNYTVDQEFDIDAYIDTLNTYEAQTGPASYETRTKEYAYIDIKEYGTYNYVHTTVNYNGSDAGNYSTPGSHKAKYHLESGKRYSVSIRFYTVVEDDDDDLTDSKFIINSMTLQDYVMDDAEITNITVQENSYPNYSFDYDEETGVYKSNNQYTQFTSAFGYVEIDLTNEDEDKELIVNATLDTYGTQNYGSVTISETDPETVGSQIGYVKGYNNSYGVNYVGPLVFNRQLTKGKKYYLQFNYVKSYEYESNGNYYHDQSFYETQGTQDQFIINSIDVIPYFSSPQNGHTYDLSTEFTTAEGTFNLSTDYGTSYLQPQKVSNDGISDGYVELDFTNKATNQLVTFTGYLYYYNTKYIYVSDSAEPISYENLKNTNKLLLSYGNYDTYQINSYTQTSSKYDYKFILKNGKKYYLHFAQKWNKDSDPLRIYGISTSDTKYSAFKNIGFDTTDDKNLRFYSKNVDNYVSFNDELWRIVGVFKTEDENGNIDNRLKIVRNSNIGSYSWDTTINDSTDDNPGDNNGGYGINEWTQADLMKLMNPGYDNNSEQTNTYDSTTREYTDNGTVNVNNSLYWNSEAGTCFKGSNNVISECDFTSSSSTKGLGETAKSYIDSVKWYLGAYDMSTSTIDAMYNGERSNRLAAENIVKDSTSSRDLVERQATWIGKVGLLYPSDIYYALDGNDSYNTRDKCMSSINNANSCISGNDYLFDSNARWTISPFYSSPSYSMMNAVTMNPQSSYTPFNVYPTVYLSTKTSISGGKGSSTDPFQLTLLDSKNPDRYYGFYDENPEIIDEPIGNVNYEGQMKKKTIAGFNYDEETGTYTNANDPSKVSIASETLVIDNEESAEDLDVFFNYDYKTNYAEKRAYIYVSETPVNIVYGASSTNEVTQLLYRYETSNGQEMASVPAGKKLYVYLGCVSEATRTNVQEFKVQIEYRKNTEKTTNYSRYEYTYPHMNEEPDTVQILKNISLDESIEIDHLKNMILDLNGYNINSSAEDYVIKNDGSLTIIDSKHERNKQNYSENNIKETVFDYDKVFTIEDYNQDNLVINYNALDHGDDDGVWKDLSGNNNDGIINGNAVWNEDGSLRFDGIDDFITFSKDLVPASKNQSVELTFKKKNDENTGLLYSSHSDEPVITLDNTNSILNIKYPYEYKPSSTSSYYNSSVGTANYDLEDEIVTYTVMSAPYGYYIYRNGVLKNNIDLRNFYSVSRRPSSYTAMDAFIGGNGEDNFASMDLYSFRLYEGTISEDIVRNNSYVDNYLFNHSNLVYDYSDVTKTEFVLGYNNSNPTSLTKLSSGEKEYSIHGLEYSEDKSYTFDSLNDYIEVDDVNENELSYNILFKIDENPENKYTLFNTTNHTNLNAYIDKNGILNVEYKFNNQIYKIKSELIEKGRIYSLLVTYSSGNVIVYLNNEQKSSSSIIGTEDVTEIDNPKIYIGKNITDNSGFIGNVYSFRSYSSVLTQDERTKMFKFDNDLYNFDYRTYYTEPSEGGISNNAYSAILNNEGAYLEINDSYVTTSKNGQWRSYANGYSIYVDCITNKGTLKLGGDSVIMGGIYSNVINNTSTGDILDGEGTIKYGYAGRGVYNQSTVDEGFGGYDFVIINSTNSAALIKASTAIFNTVSADTNYTVTNLTITKDSTGSYGTAFINGGKLTVKDSYVDVTNIVYAENVSSDYYNHSLFDNSDISFENCVLKGVINVKDTSDHKGIVMNNVELELANATTIESDIFSVTNSYIYNKSSSDFTIKADSVNFENIDMKSKLVLNTTDSETLSTGIFNNVKNSGSLVNRINLSVDGYISSDTITNSGILTANNMNVIIPKRYSGTTITNSGTLTYSNSKLNTPYIGFTNSGTLNIINSTIETTQESIKNTGTTIVDTSNIKSNVNAIINDGVLTIGNNENEVDSSFVIESETIEGVVNNSILNFYDGNIQGQIYNSLSGIVNDIPNDYDIVVRREDETETLSLLRIGQVETDDDYVVAIGEEKYTSLSAAILAALDKEGIVEIYALRDFYTAKPISIPSGKHIKINYNDKNIKIMSDGTFCTNNGSVEFYSNEENLSNINVVFANVFIENNGTLVMRNLNNKVDGNKTGIINNGITTFESGKLVNDYGNLIDNNSTFIFNDGILGSETVTITPVYDIITNDENAEFIMNDGILIGGGKILNNAGELTVSGGNLFNSGVNYDNNIGIYNTGNVSITSGFDYYNKDIGGGKYYNLVPKGSGYNMVPFGYYEYVNASNNGYFLVNKGTAEIRNVTPNGDLLNEGTITIKDSYFYNSCDVTNNESGSLVINDSTLFRLYTKGTSTATVTNTTIDSLVEMINASNLTLTNTNVENGLTFNSSGTFDMTDGGIYRGGLKITGSGTLDIHSGTIQRNSATSDNYAIKHTGTATLNLGDNDGSVSNDSPYIVSGGASYSENSFYDYRPALYVKDSNSIVNFYDGVIKGQPSVTGPINEVEDGYEMVTDDETYTPANSSYTYNYQKTYLNNDLPLLHNVEQNEDYGSFELALTGVNLGDTLKLLRNYTSFPENNTLVIDSTKRFTLDLNGKTITTNNSEFINNQGIISIVDSGSSLSETNNNGSKTYTRNSYGNVIGNGNTFINNSGVLNVSAGEIKSTSTSINNSGELNVSDKAIINGLITNSNNMNVTGGVITADINNTGRLIASDGHIASNISNSSTGVINITGGYYEAYQEGYYSFKSISIDNKGEVTIENVKTSGTINNTDSSTLTLTNVDFENKKETDKAYSPIIASGTSTVTITGGSYNNSYRVKSKSKVNGVPYNYNYYFKWINESNVITLNDQASITVDNFNVNTTGTVLKTNSLSNTVLVKNSTMKTKYAPVFDVVSSLTIQDGSYEVNDDNTYDDTSTYIGVARSALNSTIHIHGGDNTLNLEKGTIKNNNSRAIYYDSTDDRTKSITVNVGVDDGTINNSDINIIGFDYGIYSNTSLNTLNIYDGLIKARMAVGNKITAIPDNSRLVSNIENDIESLSVESEGSSNSKVIKNQNSNETYLSLQSAIDGASNGDTLKLVGDYNLKSSEAVENSKSLTLDLNGYRLLFNDQESITNTGSMTITNSKKEYEAGSYEMEGLKLSYNSYDVDKGYYADDDNVGVINNTSYNSNLGIRNYENFTYDFTFKYNNLYMDTGRDLITNVGSTNGCKLYIDSDRKLKGKCYMNSESQDVDSDIVLDYGIKYHVALSYDGNVLSLYLNGKLVDSRSTGNKSINYINKNLDASLYSDEVYSMRIYNKALSSNEILNNYKIDNGYYSISNHSGIYANYVNYPIVNNGSLTIENIAFYGNDHVKVAYNDVAYAIKNNQTLTINNSIFKVEDVYYGFVNNDGTMIINNTSLFNDTVEDSQYMILNNSEANLTINNNDNNYIYGSYIVNNAGSLIINNALIEHYDKVSVPNHWRYKTSDYVYGYETDFLSDEAILNSGTLEINDSKIYAGVSNRGVIDIDKGLYSAIYYNTAHGSIKDSIIKDLIIESINEDVTFDNNNINYTVIGDTSGNSLLYDEGNVDSAFVSGYVTMQNLSFNELSVNAAGKITADNITSSDGYIEVESGYLDLSNSNISSENTILYNNNGGVINLTNNIFDTTAYSIGTVPNSAGTFNIISGTYTGGIKNYSKNVTINLGTNDDEITSSTPIVYSLDNTSNGNVNIYDGTLRGEKDKSIIGTFNVPEGYKLAKNQVVDENDNEYEEAHLIVDADITKFVILDNVNYDSLQEALNACQPGRQCEIILFSDITLLEPIVVGEGKTVDLYVNGNTITPEEYVTNHEGTGTVTIKEGIPESQANIFNTVDSDNAMNVIIYEMDDGTNLMSNVTYTLYKDDEVVKMKRTEEIGKYEVGNRESELTTARGRIYINNLEAGNYRLVGSDNKEVVFTITEDKKIVGNVKEYTSELDNAKLIATGIAEYIINIQTGIIRSRYFILVILMTIVVSLMIVANKKRQELKNLIVSQ